MTLPAAEREVEGVHPTAPSTVDAGVRRWHLLAAIFIAAGMALRINGYLVNRSLWIDEAWLGLNLLTRTYTGLLAPLGYDQSAPPLFLWLGKLGVQLFGPGERALRLWPLLAGLALVPLLLAVAGRLLSRWAATLAVGLAAFAPMLVYYSGEIKPYILDAVVALGLLTLGLAWYRNSDELRTRRWLALAGTVALWISAPAVFVLAALGCAALTSPAVRRHPSRVAFLLKAGTLWVLSFAAAYAGFYRSAATSAYMQRFWGSSFLQPTDLEFFLRFRWALRELVWGGVFGHTSPGQGIVSVRSVWIFTAMVPILILAILGVVRLRERHGGTTALFVVGPVLLAYAASMLGRYPVALRLMLFAVPLVVILIAAGAEWTVDHMPKRWRRFARGSLVGCLLVLPFFGSVLDLVAAPNRHVRPLISEMERRRASTEAVYLSAGMIPVWLYYTTDWSAPDADRLARHEVLGRPDGPLYVNALTAGPRRPGEGRDLVDSSGGRLEIFGTPTGMEHRAYVVLTRLLPDTGWAENEAARIKEAASPGIWLLFSQHRPPAECALMWSLRQLGGRVTYKQVIRGAGLFRYEFGPPEPGPFVSIFDSPEWLEQREPEHWPVWVKTCPFIAE